MRLFTKLHFIRQCSNAIKVRWQNLLQVKVKVHTLDTEPLRSESPPQKRSGMARVLKGFHSFTYTHPHVHPQSEWAIPAFAFPAITGTYLPTQRDERLSRPWCDRVAQAEIRTCNLPIANPALYHTATSAPYKICVLIISDCNGEKNC